MSPAAWIPMRTPPPEPGLYLVFAPSEDNVRNPLMRCSWWNGAIWLELPVGWRDAVTHWRRVPMAPLEMAA